MKLSPCKGCTERYAGCHGICERYTEWKAAHDKLREDINKTKTAEWNFTDSRIKRAVKSAKKRGAMK